MNSRLFLTTVTSGPEAPRTAARGAAAPLSGGGRNAKGLIEPQELIDIDLVTDIPI